MVYSPGVIHHAPFMQYFHINSLNTVGKVMCPCASRSRSCSCGMIASLQDCCSVVVVLSSTEMDMTDSCAVGAVAARV